MPNNLEEAQAELASAEDKVKQAEVELLAARRGDSPSKVEEAEVNLRQAEVEALAARQKLQAAQ